MPTPTPSVVNRSMSDVEAQLRDVIFENEKLKIQVQGLKEQLGGTGLQHVKTLRTENATLKTQLESVTVQLEEKTAQLDLLRNSDARFSNIGDSLQDLMKQLREQREKLEEMQKQATDKDVHIEKLQQQLETQKTEVTKAQADAVTQKQSGAAEALESMQKTLQEKEAMWMEQVHQATAANEDLQRALIEVRSRCETLESERDAARAETEHAVAAAAATAEAPPSAPASAAAPCSQCEQLRQQCAALKETLSSQEARLTEAQKQVEQARAAVTKANAEAASRAAAPAVVAGPAPVAVAAFDPTSKEAKAFAQKKIDEAVQDRERRLQTLIDQNASLLSRLSLLQDNQGMARKPVVAIGAAQPQQVQAASLPPAPAPAPRQATSTSADDFKSRRKDARSAVERRFEAMLRNDIISKEDVQLLLQEVLDYQEKIDLDTQTQLYIKDLQMDDAAKEVHLKMERVENENRSLTKELQREAFQGLQRARTGSNGNGEAAAAGAYDAVLQMENPWGPARHPTAAPLSGAGTPPRASGAGQAPAASGASSPGLIDSPAYTIPRAQQQQQQQQQHADPNAAAGPRAHAPQQYPAGNAGGVGAGAGAGGSGGRGAKAVTFQVACPACTFEQPYGSGKCQLCDSNLPSPALH